MKRTQCTVPTIGLSLMGVSHLKTTKSRISTARLAESAKCVLWSDTPRLLWEVRHYWTCRKEKSALKIKKKKSTKNKIFFINKNFYELKFLINFNFNFITINKIKVYLMEILIIANFLITSCYTRATATSFSYFLSFNSPFFCYFN